MAFMAERDEIALVVHQVWLLRYRDAMVHLGGECRVVAVNFERVFAKRMLKPKSFAESSPCSRVAALPEAPAACVALSLPLPGVNRAGHVSSAARRCAWALGQRRH
jgi:hypothetical protein